MKYKRIEEGRFLSRPNRFIAEVMIDGKKEICHVKNTGRCRELLIPGVQVYLEVSDNPKRSTKYDLVAVKKGEMLINVDSMAPNKAVAQWLDKGGIWENIRLIRPETTYGESRFDFYMETERDKIFIEVKGVTLENEGVVMFPDAPTQRGVKHINELVAASKVGYKTYILFVVQMSECKYFTPNRATHPEFANALRFAKENGVEILAYNCKLTAESMELFEPVEVKL